MCSKKKETGGDQNFSKFQGGGTTLLGHCADITLQYSYQAINVLKFGFVIFNTRLLAGFLSEALAAS